MPAETGDWETKIEFEPYHQWEANVVPLDSPDRNLYLVVWTIPAGTCVPYSAPGNAKDGAIVLIVQEGVVEFTAEPLSVGSGAEVSWGNAVGEGGTLPFGETRTLNRGDWVTQNDQVWFTLRSVGSVSAVVLKAVWAIPSPLDPCSGGCK